MEYATRNTQHASPSKRLGLALAITVTLTLLFGWARSLAATVQQEPGGLEGMVRHSDFRSALTGALIISEGNGARLYDLDVQRIAQSSVLAPYYALGDTLLPYNHMPFEAISIAPLMGLPYPAAFGLWSLLMFASVALSLWLMNAALPIVRPAVWIVALAVFSYGPLLRSFMLGQNSPLVLLGLCAAYAALKREQPTWAGVALCLAALKPQVLPIVLLLLVLQQQWRTLAVFAGTFGALCLAAMLVLGVGWPLQYAQLLLGVANWNDAGAINPGVMHNWRGFATNLFGGQAPALVTPVFVLLSLLSAGLLVWTARFWILDFGFWRKSNRDIESKIQNPKSKIQNDLLWALAGVLAVLTSLHLNPHDLTLLVFPAWIIAAYALNGAWNARQSIMWLVILWAGYALPSLGDAGELVIPSVLLMATAAGLLAFKRGVKREA